MLLKDKFELTEKQNKSLERRGYISCEHYLRMLPKKYHDYRKVKTLNPNLSGEDVAVYALFEECKYDRGKHMATAKLREYGTDTRITINWIGGEGFAIFRKTCGWPDKTPVLVGGMLQYSYQFGAYSFFNPFIFTNEVTKDARFYQEYGTMKDLKAEEIVKMHNESLDIMHRELLPGFVIKKYGLMDVSEMYKTFQFPENESQLRKACYRMDIEQLLYYAVEMEKADRELPKGTSYHIKTIKNTLDMVKNLPYKLTKGQSDVCNLFHKKMKEGRRINALVQGDVGTGKTMVAFIAMFMMADNGYQSVLMAPTYVLATQHYKQLSELSEKYGYKVAFLGGKQKVSEKKKILSGIEKGEYTFIVGTHGVFSSNVRYNDLALVVTDEEHRFGVLQREEVAKKADKGVHTITMSATPIPRTVASVLYGNNLEICTIKEKPAGRKEIKTEVYNNQGGICKFMEQQILAGRQAYVICPLIEKAEKGSKMEKIDSIEEISRVYKEHFMNMSVNKSGSDVPVRVEILTGSTPADEATKILEDFSKGDIHILVATTVVEVGVNVPNASLMVIHNAERFGMAALHQLRGRVGRGQYQSYCILKSDCIEEGSDDQDARERLTELSQTEDGYEVALADLRHRGTGDLVGTDQSGNNRFIDLILRNRILYEKIKMDASILCDNGTDDEYIQLFKDQYDYQLTEEAS